MTVSTDINNLNIKCDTDSSGLDSSTELERPKVIPAPSNGFSKRCGVIFVHSENRRGIDEDWRWRKNSRVFSFLVVKGRSSNIWSFPKGRMSDDDMLDSAASEEQCAIREVLEETGIILSSVSHMPRIVIGKNVYFICHTDKSEFSTFTIHDTYEVGEVSWKTVDQLREIKCNKDLRAILKYPKHRQGFHDIVFNKVFPGRNMFKYKQKIW